MSLRVRVCGVAHDDRERSSTSCHVCRLCPPLHRTTMAPLGLLAAACVVSLVHADYLLTTYFSDGGCTQTLIGMSTVQAPHGCETLGGSSSRTITCGTANQATITTFSNANCAGVGVTSQTPALPSPAPLPGEDSFPNVVGYCSARDPAGGIFSPGGVFTRLTCVVGSREVASDATGITFVNLPSLSSCANLPPNPASPNAGNINSFSNYPVNTCIGTNPSHRYTCTNGAATLTVFQSDIACTAPAPPAPTPDARTYTLGCGPDPIVLTPIVTFCNGSSSTTVAVVVMLLTALACFLTA